VPLTRLSATGVFVGHHLETETPADAASFYLKLFGWTTREIRVAGSPGEITLRSGDADVATVGPLSTHGAGWLPCFAASDPQGMAAEARRLAAWPPAEDLPGGCAVTDPTGARFAVVGLALVPPHGVDPNIQGRICWTELRTDDPGAAAAYYRGVAGWTAVERHGGQEGRYWVFFGDGQEVAGMTEPLEARGYSCWVPYVLVESAEETAELAADLGGSIDTPPGDVPGRGRFAVLRDIAGARIGVFASTDAA
jgi:uncharacterized protein